MKSFSLLSVLAITISTTFSQPHDAATDSAPESAPINARSYVVPKACHDTNVVVYDQLVKFSQLQSKNLPVTHDLAGYLYAVSSGRNMLGCPNETLISANGNDESATDQFKRDTGTVQHGPGWGDPCDVVRSLKAQADDQIRILSGYNISTPDYLAGWYSGTQDMDEGLQCGLIHKGSPSDHHNGPGSAVQ